jgi:hypothetical protein
MLSGFRPPLRAIGIPLLSRLDRTSKAKDRFAAAYFEIMWELLIDKKTPHATRFGIIKDILDRAGFKPVDKSEVAINWDGDLSKLDDEGLARLAYYMERLAYGEDRARMLDDKRRTLIEAGAAPDVIEAEFSGEDDEGDISADEMKPEGW